MYEQPSPLAFPAGDIAQFGESWFHIEGIDPGALRTFLEPLVLHSLTLERCLIPKNAPDTISYEQIILLEFPSALDLKTEIPDYLTLILKEPILVTIHQDEMPAINELINSLLGGDVAKIDHLPQIVYLIIDHLAYLNVQAEIDVHDQILLMAKALVDKPDSVTANDITRVRWQVDKLVSLIENQLFCVSRLNSTDTMTIQDPHRKAYIQDLLSEAQIAQNGIYRLENRVNDLFSYYQMAGSDRVEKRLRLLTIISAITLPLGLITGLLGMNVGGVPGTTMVYAFLFVIILMIVVALIEF